MERELHSFLCSDTEPAVRTKYGSVHGFMANGMYTFRGIPYAKAKRFQPPEEPDCWEGLRPATDYGYACPFWAPNGSGVDPVGDIFTPRRLWYSNEACQYLNVWTPSADPAAKRPVMFWIHGGGYFAGSSTDLYAYDGAELARTQDVVVVSINHRLNLLGFLDLSAYAPEYRQSGYVGMLDVVAALRWVQDNIAAFGGDPGNVTVFGQSGGGAKVCNLLQMPSADGLFHKAIVQSGIMGPRSGLGGTKQQALETADAIVAELGLTGDTIREIEQLSYEDMMRTAFKVYGEKYHAPALGWYPVPDDEGLFGNPLSAGFRRETLHIPMIVGTCLCEFDPDIPTGPVSDEARTNRLRRRFGDDAEQAASAFAAAYPALDPINAAVVDNGTRRSSLEFCRKRREDGGAPTWIYQFTFDSPYMGGRLTGHNGEIPFVFHNALYTGVMFREGITARLQDDMAGAWARLARRGDPNRDGETVWEPYTVENGACMLFGRTTAPAHHHDDALLALLDAHPAASRP